MKNLKKILIALLSVASLFCVHNVFASVLPIAPAIFETGLSAPLAITDTSLTLASANLSDGTSLSGFVCLTIDTQQPNTEYACGTASSTSPTTIMNLTRGIDVLDGTTSVSFLIQSHRRGADVRITNFPLDTLMGRLLSGVTTFDNILSYTGLPTFTGASQLVDKNYVDTIAFSGAGVINATTGARGIVQIATQTQTASSTATGSSGALLVIPSSNATSTFNVATAPLRVVVTQNSGKIDPNFIQGGINSTFTGTTTMATTTINGANPWGLLAQQTATTSASITITNIPPRSNLQFVIYANESTNSSFNAVFNGDGGNNYNSFGAYYPSPGSSSAGASLNQPSFMPTNTSGVNLQGILTMNVFGSNATPKFVNTTYSGWGGTNSLLQFSTTTTVWNNTSSFINSLNITSNGSLTGTIIKVYGDTSSP